MKEVDIDSLILNDESDLTSAIIYYNELQVKEIEVII